MVSVLSNSFVGLTAALLFAFATFVKADYDIHHPPHTTDAAHGQAGVNDCVKTYGDSNPNAKCQTAVINSVTDFCLWAPDHSATIGDRERDVVAYCTKSGYGTRLIPQGTIKGAQFRKTPSFVQVTGLCDCTKINVAPGDEGGELDPHGADGSGNPVGGIVFTNAYGNNPQNYMQINEWSSFIGADEFSFRGCIGPNAADYCPHIYDEQGSEWNHPGRYESGIFENCDATEGKFPGVYHGHRWHQGDGPTPPAHKAGRTSNCKQFKGIKQTRSRGAPTLLRRALFGKAK
ncbi:unnamed protein product [Tilletia caries]|uniref:Uncharacterized protein n=1 Tax=Tilletia caries TaxID=13290 RepID=A0ABN7J494_9BASI|nr:hypothetical protein CF336_g5527 [Tilletia laevis]KAE8193680.1 hypothetical protein CF328_g4978 [Tilletia controversa]CAD6931253.1 unnamed protein product [Tilletia caries]CAD6946043.1 unnamed protein product [Tilletia caries]